MFMCIICTLVRRMYYAILDPYRLGCSHFRVPTDFDDVASSLQRRFVAMIMQSVWWAVSSFYTQAHPPERSLCGGSVQSSVSRLRLCADTLLKLCVESASLVLCSHAGSADYRPSDTGVG